MSVRLFRRFPDRPILDRAEQAAAAPESLRGEP